MSGVGVVAAAAADPGVEPNPDITLMVGQPTPMGEGVGVVGTAPAWMMPVTFPVFVVNPVAALFVGHIARSLAAAPPQAITA